MSTPKASHTAGRLEWLGNVLEGVDSGEAVIDPEVKCLPHCYGGTVDLGMTEANAARLVSCWNALDGVPDPEGAVSVALGELEDAWRDVRDVQDDLPPKRPSLMLLLKNAEDRIQAALSALRGEEAPDERK